MMYLAFAPKSIADVGAIVALSEKIVSSDIAIRRNRKAIFLFTGYSPYGNRICPISR
jgi:hypothetical protein